MERNLVFNDTLTVEQFKAAMHVDKLRVKKNPRQASYSLPMVQRLEL